MKFRRPRNADKANITKLNVQVLPSDLALVYGIGTLVAVLSTGLSNISVLRLKPKEILTQGE
jgi:ABC-type lipoprotein release transport system permease subunit